MTMRSQWTWTGDRQQARIRQRLLEARLRAWAWRVTDDE